MALERRLDRLAEQINQEHRGAQAAFGKTLQHVKRAGQLLLEAKERLPHGEWLSWLEANFDGSVTTAQNYKRIYTRWADLEANTQSAAHLTLTEALRAIAPPQATATTQDQATAITRERAEGPLRRAGVEAREEPTEVEDREPGVEAGEEPTEPREPFSVEEGQDYAKRVNAQEKAREDAEERYRQEQRKRHGRMFLDVDADVSKARRAIKSALEKIKDGDIPFDDEEVELLERQNEAVQGISRLFSAALTGDSDTDWDAELYELEQRRQWGPE